MQVNRLAFLAASCAIIFQACMTRQEIKAHLWENNGLPADLCASEPRLQDHGFFRRLDSGQYELLSFCKPEARGMQSVTKESLKEILDATLPENNGR